MNCLGNDGTVEESTVGGITVDGTVEDGTVGGITVDGEVVVGKVSWGSDGTSGIGTSGIGNWGGLSDDWGGDWGLDWGNNWGFDGGVVDGLGLVDGLVDGGSGGDWANDGLVSMNWDVLVDWVGNVGGSDNWGWLTGFVNFWDVGVDGFSNWVGEGAQFWGDTGESMSFRDGVSEVATESVVFESSRIMFWGTDNGGWTISSLGDGGGVWGSWGWDNSSAGSGDQSSESDESVHVEFK